MKPVRYLIPLAVLAVLALTGVVDVSLLPWKNAEFQTSLGVVLVYLFWSAAGSGGDGADRMAMYAVLLVSTIDSFLLRMTVFSGLLPLRWAGVVLLAAGSAMLVLHRGRIGVYRTGRIMQLFGIPLGLGTLAGIAVAVFPGLVFALKEDLPE
jgi:hypothetical protein